jgi:CubicO group peptidase (beta-lactamase class C family)
MTTTPALALILTLVPALPCARGQDTVEPPGIDETPIAALVERVQSGNLPNVHAVLVARGGALVVEEYFAGWTADRVHYTASVSKSVGSLLLGVAMQLEILAGIDEGVLDRPVAELYPAYRELIEADEAKERLLLRHVLSMTAGLDWDESSQPYGETLNDCNRAEVSEDPLAFVLARRVLDEPGSRFEYNGGLSMMLSHLLEEQSGLTAAEFAEEVLFEPLGIETFAWEPLRPSGLTDTSGGLHLRPRDMVLVGQLALDGGRWNGEQLVSAAWLRESTRRHTATDDGPDYGLQWWSGDLRVRGSEVHTFFASGHGGQKIFVVPALEAVVVVTQQVFDNPAGHLNALAIMTSHVLPALLPAGEHDAAPVEAVVLERPGRYVGAYASVGPGGAGDSMRVELADGTLFAVGSDDVRVELVPVGGNDFVCVLAGILEVPVHFRESDEGEIVAVDLRFGFRHLVFRRE